MVSTIKRRSLWHCSRIDGASTPRYIIRRVNFYVDLAAAILKYVNKPYLDLNGSASVRAWIYYRSNDCYYYRVKRKRDAYSQMDISNDAVNLDVKSTIYRNGVILRVFKVKRRKLAEKRKITELYS